MFWLWEGERAGEKRRARLDGVADALGDGREIEQGGTPPEIGSQIDGQIIAFALKLSGSAEQQCIGCERMLRGPLKAREGAGEQTIDGRMARYHLTGPGT